MLLPKKNLVFTWDERLVISFRNHGMQVRDNIDKTDKNVTRVTNLEMLTTQLAFDKK